MKNIAFVVLLLFSFINGYSADYYWVGGNGNWSDFQHHWALSSGGNVFQTQVPGSTDNVYFDAQSFPAL